jgi:hypothetical protein
MNVFASPRFLPTVLRVDAASCAATGLLQLVAAPALAAWFGLPQGLLTATGWFLLAVCAFALWASRAPIRRPAVWILVLGNAAWVLGCVELLVTGAAATALGQAWLVVQALAVGLLAELEWMGLKRAPAAAWA